MIFQVRPGVINWHGAAPKKGGLQVVPPLTDAPKSLARRFPTRPCVAGGTVVAVAPGKVFREAADD